MFDSALVCSQNLPVAMKGMNTAKQTSADLSLFNGLIEDLFPAVEIPIIDHGVEGLSR